MGEDILEPSLCSGVRIIELLCRLLIKISTNCTELLSKMLKLEFSRIGRYFQPLSWHIWPINVDLSQLRLSHDPLARLLRISIKFSGP